MYEAVKGRGRIDRKLLNIKWVTCVFLFKNEVSSGLWVDEEVAPGGLAHPLGVSLEVQT